MKGSRLASIGDTFKLWLLSCIKLLLILPLWILFQVYALPKQVDPMWMTALPLLSLVGILLRHLCNVRWKQLLAALILGGILGISSAGLSIDALPLGVAGLFCAYLGITAEVQNKRFNWFWMGLTLYFLATIIFHRVPALETTVPLLTWSGALCLILALFFFNHDYLQYSTLSEDNKSLPRGIKRNNRLYVIVIGIVAALLAAGIGQAIGIWLWKFIRAVIAFMIKLFSGSSEPITEPEALPTQTANLPLGNDKEPGLLAAIFDILVYVAAAAIIGALLYFALRWVYRNAGGTLRRLMDKVRALLFREQPFKEPFSFQDEENSVFAWEQKVQGFKEFWSNRLHLRSRKDRWDQMNDDNERVRWLYRRWLDMNRANGYKAKQYLTPKETAQDVLKWGMTNKQQSKNAGEPSSSAKDLIELYEKVRYGEGHPSSSDVVALKDQMKL